MPVDTNKPDDLSVVVQAGGESRRMGAPKATVPFLGHALIWQPVKRLYPIATEMIITTNDIESIEAVFEKSDFTEIRYEQDIHNERGALNGLYTALCVAQQPYVALSACDDICQPRTLYVRIPHYERREIRSRYSL